ncbi:hypothetical protein C8F04DRAFT_1185687 [Mycena alexandri]|uniref:Uncharacterized protein n=1 Tax=Mycena alexandri TaxID=1745969 RepID=A0AAD6X078_9AGAR|nr:hypothetical protein C8F04DRAFT_1195597 [Mycena alexandri]KAJ7031762.1 hypothetical protein C8F04DRAFT_1185687 [Mycena alexandri]
MSTTPLRIPFADKLIDHQRAWVSLVWRSEAVVEVRPSMSSAYDFVGGSFRQQNSQSGFRKISLDSAIAQVLLPPKEFEETWSDFATLVTYPSEDLLVSLGLYSGLDDLVFSVGVKMWSLAKLQTQEGAADDFLLILDQSEDFSPHYSMHIEEDVIAVFAQPGSGSQDESAQLALVNWKTEVLILDTFAVAHDTDPEFPRHSLFSLPCASGPTSDFGSSFGFLSRRSYLLTHTHDSGQIQIYTFERDSDESSPIHRATLMLPQLQPGSELMETTIVTSPFSGHVPQLGALFSKSRERCIYVIGLRYQTGEVRGKRVAFAIEHSLAIFDFGVGAARFQFDNSSFVREPSIVGHGLFAEPAMTWLPCRRSRREMGAGTESTTFIIDQDRVIEVGVRYSFGALALYLQ